MSGWVTLPLDLADEAKSQWVGRALEHIATLPPKVKKPAAKKAVPGKV